MLLAAACGRSATSTADASALPDGSTTVDAPPGTPDAAPAGCAGVYTTSTISSMRMGTVSGCFELDNVVSIGTTPSTASPELFVQDPVGGDFSAMEARCSSTSTKHPCSVAAQVAAIADGRSVTIQGTYIKSKTTGFEAFYVDTIADKGTGTMPAPAIATLADIERGGTAKKFAFERVTTTIAAADTLGMYDWSPAEFVNMGATKCPYQFAFGMIPKSVTATATAACTSATAQPTGQATPNAAEVLIGTDFYKGFTVSSDCQCAKKFSDTEPSAGSKISGSISGVLIYDTPFSGGAGYYYLAPKSASDAVLTATVPGM